MAIVVTRKANDTDDKIISRFRKLMVQTNRVDDIKKKKNHLKPSQERYQSEKSKKKRRPYSAY